MVLIILKSHLNCVWYSWHLTKGGLKRGGAREVEFVTELVWVLAPAPVVTVAAGWKWTSTATVVRPNETWWERRRGGLPWEMVRLWWIGAVHASGTCRVSEEWRPSASLDGESEGEQVDMDDGGGNASWHGLEVSPLWLVQSSEHRSWTLGWDKLQSSREGSTLKSKECPQLLTSSYNK